MNFLTQCSITHGCWSARHGLYVTVMNDAMAENREQHAVPLVWRHGAWSGIVEEPVVPWIAAGIAASDDDMRSVAAMVGWGGQVLAIGDRGCGREGLQRRDGEGVSIVRAVREIGDAIYTVGLRRQVYRRTAEAGWTAYDDGAFQVADDSGVGFESIDGDAAGALYAAGLHGELWRCSGGHWQAIQSPTNVHLHALRCAPDGYTYVGGRSGVLLRGSGESWDVRTLETVDTIWDLCSFGGRMFLILGGAVCTYDWASGELAVQRDAVQDDHVALCGAGDRLIVLGRKTITAFDSGGWRDIGTDLAADALAFPLNRLIGGEA